jgi:hypothetical protein
MEKGRRWRGLAGRLAGFLVVGAVVFFIARALARSWNEIPFDQFRLSPGWLALSYAGLVASFALTIRAWQVILGSMGQGMGYRASWWVVTGSYLAKYIPGHVWAVGGRMWLCKRQGVPEKYSGTGMLLEMMLLLLSSLAIFGSGLPLVSGRGAPEWGWLLLIPAPFILATLFTPMLRWALRTAAKIALKREIALDIKRGGMARALLLMVASSAVQGMAFFALARSIYPVETGYLPHLTALYNGSWAAGFLSIVAPGGLGVREGALVLFLKPYLPVSVAIIIAAAARLWITVFEIAMALVGLYMRKAG